MYLKTWSHPFVKPVIVLIFFRYAIAKVPISKPRPLFKGENYAQIRRLSGAETHGLYLINSPTVSLSTGPNMGDANSYGMVMPFSFQKPLIPPVSEQPPPPPASRPTAQISQQAQSKTSETTSSLSGVGEKSITAQTKSSETTASLSAGTIYEMKEAAAWSNLGKRPHKSSSDSTGNSYSSVPAAVPPSIPAPSPAKILPLPLTTLTRIAPTPVMFSDLGPCEDKIKEWTDLLGYSCKDYVENGYCTPNKGYGPGWEDDWGDFSVFAVNGVAATEACCKCGAVELKTRAPKVINDLELSPVPAPTPRPTPHIRTPKRPAEPLCEDANGWVDSFGFTCETYSRDELCTPTKGYGIGWGKDWGKFEAYANFGLDATKACCSCGRETPHTAHTRAPKLTEAVAGTSTCTDMKGWADSLGHSCMYYSENQFCNSDKSYGPGWGRTWGTFYFYSNYGMDATQACCKCGGGSAAADVPKNCNDVYGWTDSVGHSCLYYSENQFCNADKSYGPGWGKTWGSFNIYMNFGMDATQACCKCGGGASETIQAIDQNEVMNTMDRRVAKDSIQGSFQVDQNDALNIIDQQAENDKMVEDATTDKQRQFAAAKDSIQDLDSLFDQEVEELKKEIAMQTEIIAQQSVEIAKALEMEEEKKAMAQEQAEREAELAREEQEELAKIEQELKSINEQEGIDTSVAGDEQQAPKEVAEKSLAETPKVDKEIEAPPPATVPKKTVVMKRMTPIARKPGAAAARATPDASTGSTVETAADQSMTTSKALNSSVTTADALVDGQENADKVVDTPSKEEPDSVPQEETNTVSNLSDVGATSALGSESSSSASGADAKSAASVLSTDEKVVQALPAPETTENVVTENENQTSTISETAGTDTDPGISTVDNVSPETKPARVHSSPATLEDTTTNAQESESTVVPEETVPAATQASAVLPEDTPATTQPAAPAASPVENAPPLQTIPGLPPIESLSEEEQAKIATFQNKWAKLKQEMQSAIAERRIQAGFEAVTKQKMDAADNYPDKMTVLKSALEEFHRQISDKSDISEGEVENPSTGDAPAKENVVAVGDKDNTSVIQRKMQTLQEAIRKARDEEGVNTTAFEMEVNEKMAQDLTFPEKMQFLSEAVTKLHQLERDASDNNGPEQEKLTMAEKASELVSAQMADKAMELAPAQETLNAEPPSAEVQSSEQSGITSPLVRARAGENPKSDSTSETETETAPELLLLRSTGPANSDTNTQQEPADPSTSSADLPKNSEEPEQEEETEPQANQEQPEDNQEDTPATSDEEEEHPDDRFKASVIQYEDFLEKMQRLKLALLNPTGAEVPKAPTRKPVTKATSRPVMKPTRRPTSHPVRKPTSHPVRKPTKAPVRVPTRKPYAKPSKKPTFQPTPKRTGTEPSDLQATSPLSSDTSAPRADPSTLVPLPDEQLTLLDLSATEPLPVESSPPYADPTISEPLLAESSAPRADPSTIIPLPVESSTPYADSNTIVPLSVESSTPHADPSTIVPLPVESSTPRADPNTIVPLPVESSTPKADPNTIVPLPVESAASHADSPTKIILADTPSADPATIVPLPVESTTPHADPNTIFPLPVESSTPHADPNTIVPLPVESTTPHADPSTIVPLPVEAKAPHADPTTIVSLPVDSTPPHADPTTIVPLPVEVKAPHADPTTIVSLPVDSTPPHADPTTIVPLPVEIKAPHADPTTIVPLPVESSIPHADAATIVPLPVKSSIPHADATTIVPLPVESTPPHADPNTVVPVPALSSTPHADPTTIVVLPDRPSPPQADSAGIVYLPEADATSIVYLPEADATGIVYLPETADPSSALSSAKLLMKLNSIRGNTVLKQNEATDGVLLCTGILALLSFLVIKLYVRRVMIGAEYEAIASP